MQVKWGKMTAKVAVWLATEILLTVAGLDNLADYGEFILGDYALIQRPFQIVLLTQPRETWHPFNTA